MTTIFSNELCYTLCYTLVDITNTGVFGSYRADLLPYRRNNGELINNEEQWILARNQQRNWETLMQLISLRCQPMSIDASRKFEKQALNKYKFGKNNTGKHTVWTFRFSTEYAAVYDNPGDRYGALKADALQVPVITGLKETAKIDNMLITSGPFTNIYFERDE